MCSDPANGGFVCPPVTNCCMHGCPGYIPTHAPMLVRPRVLRRRRGEGDETYDPPPKTAQEVAQEAAEKAVSVLNPTAFASRLAMRARARKAAAE